MSLRVYKVVSYKVNNTQCEKDIEQDKEDGGEKGMLRLLNRTS